MAWLSDRRPDWSRGDLLPVVVTDAARGDLLMLAWANREALAATERSGEAHFWSRSRNELWRKGATSGNTMRVVDMTVDCDGDAIAYRVEPAGPACHIGARSCFDGDDRFDLGALERIIGDRRDADPAQSYTARLLSAGSRRAAEKVTEEAGELSSAALAGSDDEVVAEAADLLYHALVLLASRRIGLAAVEEDLARRHATR
ncbi:MAG: bifunctional phosphoribosyl-AMP cyclohydrolase/phosphoribosyl-ATP diphosphatase HisIE [Candidatus Limnocylindria bacterium]